MSLEFEPLARTPSYLDSVEPSTFSMLDNSMDYLQYPNPPSPAFSLSSPSMDFNALVEPFASGNYTAAGANYTTASPPRSFSPAVESASISPPTLTYHLSAGEMDSDDSGRRSRGENPTPPPVPYSASIPRSHRYNPLAIPATRSSARAAHKRRHSKSSNDHDSDAEEEEEYQPSSGGVDPRREAVRRQRIESEQRRRDELREGYARLKAVLPPSTAKSSKVSLLDRAAHHLKHLEACRLQAEARLKATEAELVRVRSLNEVLSLRAVQQREAAMAASGMTTASFN
jgi:hypothetical protein